VRTLIPRGVKGGGGNKKKRGRNFQQNEKKKGTLQLTRAKKNFVEATFRKNVKRISRQKLQGELVYGKSLLLGRGKGGTRGKKRFGNFSIELEISIIEGKKNRCMGHEKVGLESPGRGDVQGRPLRCTTKELWTGEKKRGGKGKKKNGGAGVRSRWKKTWQGRQRVQPSSDCPLKRKEKD